MIFTKPTIDFLKKMGWSPDRCTEPASLLTSLSDEGYGLFPLIQDFLASFGGLEGEMPAYRKEDEMEQIHFHPEIALEAIYREKVMTYEDRVEEQLVVVGEAYNGHLTLMLSGSGKFFGGYDDYLCLLGNNVAEGITALFEQKESKEIL